MKRFFERLSLIGLIGTYPKSSALAFMTTMGIGILASGALHPPALVPQPAAFMSNQNGGVVNRGLKSNAGTIGAQELPVTPANSFAQYVEGTVSTGLGYGSFETQVLLGNSAAGTTASGIQISGNAVGNPAWYINKNLGGAAPGTNFWNAIGTPTLNGAYTVSGGSGHVSGIYPFATTNVVPCARQPAGVWTVGVAIDITDPGFLCPTASATVTTPIGGAQDQQKAGLNASLSAITCATGPVSGEITLTALVPIAHGVVGGQTFALGGLAAPFATTYTAIAGTGGTTLVGEAAINSGTCSGFTDNSAATAFTGTGTTFALAGTAITGPFNIGGIGITAGDGKHFCGVIGEYGADSPFPGAQFASFVDDKGNPFPGAPSLVPWLNQGTATATGYTTTGAQPGLNITAMISFTITNAVYSAGEVTFTTSTNPGFIPGSEFTVTGMNPSGYNQTYVAVAGTSGTTIVGNPLSGPVGTPQALSNPGSFVSGGGMVSVIMPDMQIFGAAAGTVIDPYGSSSSTGVGGTGSYSLSINQTTPIGSVGSPVTLWMAPAFYQTVGNGTVTARTRSSLGDFMGNSTTATVIGSNNGNQIGNQVGWSGVVGNVAMLYGVFPQSTGGVPSTSALASLCTKTTDIQDFAIAHGFGTGDNRAVHSLYRLNDLGTFGDSSNATITGYITNPGGSSATLNVVSTVHGTLALTTSTETAQLTGPGLSPSVSATIPLTTSASSTYAITPNTTAALGSIGSPVTFAVGFYSPATPISEGAIVGGVSGNTLTVTGIGSPDATCTGTLANNFTGSISGTTLTMTGFATGNPILAAGTTITDATPTITPGTVIVSQLTSTATGSAPGLNGTYQVNNSQSVGSETMFAVGQLPSKAATLNLPTCTGTVQKGMVFTDGGGSITGAPIQITGTSGPAWAIVPTYNNTFVNDSALIGTNAWIVPGDYLYGNAITTPIKVISYGSGQGLLGTYTVYNPGSVSVGPGATISISGVTDAGAPAPGTALTVNGVGHGATYPVLNYGSGTGSIPLSGQYDTSLLGGTPTILQAQISYTAGGPPVPGCSACAWTNLTGYSATLSSGTIFNWSGSAVNIPASTGPLYVAIRAANGPGYAMLPSGIRVGLLFDWQGEGQLGAIASSQGGSSNAPYVGLFGYSAWGNGQDTGPPVTGTYVPAQTLTYPGDRYAITGGTTPVAEGVGTFEQLLTNAFNWPTSVLNNIKDGIGLGIYNLGYATQAQTIAVADGTKTSWCSAAIYCANNTAVLAFNAATQTGGMFSGSVATVGGTSTLTVAGAAPGWPSFLGSLEPGMTLSDLAGNVTGAPTLVRCVTGCSGTYSASTWILSSNQGTISSEWMRADLGSTPYPYWNAQAGGLTFGITGAWGSFVIQAGTFQITVNGTKVCQDNVSTVWNNQGGNCTGAGISSSFVNYMTGDYQVTFSSPPAANAVIIASWTNLVSPDIVTVATNRPSNFDWTGSAVSPQTGSVASLLSKAPGGVNGHLFSGGISDSATFRTQGYNFAAQGYTQMVNWLYNTRFAGLPNQPNNAPLIVAHDWRAQGPADFSSGVNEAAETEIFAQWTADVSKLSNFNGTISGSVLTLTSAATGWGMWEGELIGCNPFSYGCSVAAGTYITSLASGSWGANGSTYNITGSCTGSCTNIALMNAAQYPGSVIYGGTLNDFPLQNTGGLGLTTGVADHPIAGVAGARRFGARLAALTWCSLSNSNGPCTDTNLDRSAADAGGCASGAIASPCFDYGNTYAASASGTISGATITITGGLSANARPFTDGMALSCAGCNTGLFILSVSAPPTQSSVAGAGQVGNTFTITASGSLGVSTTETVTGGCSGVVGTGSNCIDIAFNVNTTGTFGTAAALATCGENNLNGNTPGFGTTNTNAAAPNGKCVSNGIGSLVRNFRIGTAQAMWGSVHGSVYDDGMDPFGGSFLQSSAFTCNIVAAKGVQCVKGVNYTTPATPAIGQWATGSTYVEYGDGFGTGRVASLMGNVGGQPIPFTAGTGGTAGTTTLTGSGCGLAAGGVNPKIDITISGGAIVDAYPSAANDAIGLGVGGPCTFTPGSGSGTITQIPTSPTEGIAGIATYNSDSNMMGVQLYDNTGFVGNPLNKFFSNGNGGYFEPGLTVQPFGMFQGAAVADGSNVGFLLPSGESLHFINTSGNGGSDSNDGLAPTVAGGHGPWLTPNHALKCGDVILVGPGTYATSWASWGTPTNCPSTTGGIDGTGGINFEILLCAGTNLGACNINSPSGHAMDIAKNNWAVEGFSGTAPTNADVFFADACAVTSTQHHVAFINNIAHNAGYGFQSGPCSNSFSNDYLAVVGNIIQNANAYTGGSAFCGAALDVVVPHQFDTNAGTHIYVAGNFVYANLGPTPHSDCAADIEGMMADTFDGLGGYTQQSVWADNLVWDNAGWGFHLFDQFQTTAAPTFLIHNNTFFGNSANIPSAPAFWAAELDFSTGNGAGGGTWVITAQNNIARTNGATAASGTQNYAVTYGNIQSTQPTKPTVSSNTFFGQQTACVNGGFAGVCQPSNSVAYTASCCDSSNYVPGTNNYTDPLFANTTDLLTNWVGAPSCGSVTMTDACMGWNFVGQSASALTPIGDLIASGTGTSGQGYRGAGPCVATLAEYPTWLKGIVTLSASSFTTGATLTQNPGLVTKPCGL